jgi:hypothetical protein
MITKKPIYLTLDCYSQLKCALKILHLQGLHMPMLKTNKPSHQNGNSAEFAATLVQATISKNT